MWIVPLHHVHYIQSLPEGTAPLFRMFPAAWLNSKPSSWQLEKWQNFCEAALSVSYNRRFLWNDFVKLTTLFGFFFVLDRHILWMFSNANDPTFLGNLQITPNQWIYDIQSKCSFQKYCNLNLSHSLFISNQITVHPNALIPTMYTSWCTFSTLKTLPLPGNPEHRQPCFRCRFWSPRLRVRWPLTGGRLLGPTAPCDAGSDSADSSEPMVEDKVTIWWW